MEPSPWSWDVGWGDVAAVALGVAAYAAAARRWPPSRARAASFGAGALLVLLVLVSPVATLAVEYLLSAHLFQNVALAEWAPALVVFGLSPGMALAAGRVRALRLLTVPVVALPVWLVNYAVWHIPPVYDAALRSEPLLGLEHAMYFATGLLLWWCVFQAHPWRIGDGAKSLYLFAAFMLASPIGLLLALLPSPAYRFYVEAPEIWGMDPLKDQQFAGIIMAGSESVVFFGLFCVFFLRFMTSEEAR